MHRETRNVVDVNTDIDPALFAFPDSVSPVFDPDLAARGEVSHQYIQSFAALGFPRDGLQPFVTAADLGEGVFHLTGGSHHSLAVVQDEGVVIVEAPLDEVRTTAVMEWVENELGQPITHVVMSHHHADHSGGLRAYVAAGITVVMHEAAVPFFENVFTAPSTLVADTLANNPVDANIEPVPMDGSVVLTSDTNPVGVYPIDTSHSEDLVMVEAGGVVFVVDIYSPFPGAPLPPVARTIHALITDLGLDVHTIAGGHGGTIGFDTFEGALP